MKKSAARSDARNVCVVTASRSRIASAIRDSGALAFCATGSCLSGKTRTIPQYKEEIQSTGYCLSGVAPAVLQCKEEIKHTILSSHSFAFDFEVNADRYLSFPGIPLKHFEIG
ncbi:jg558 [Pararge aegeria aegeria]|uniref:Jg558 protein n=1 Tax=Pararge aegeria aegeria TaxID=348720 RepID=A0A8S4QVE2_9NEOP|nr:jg558 [Pararge aegeria aegeria]